MHAYSRLQPQSYCYFSINSFIYFTAYRWPSPSPQMFLSHGVVHTKFHTKQHAALIINKGGVRLLEGEIGVFCARIRLKACKLYGSDEVGRVNLFSLRFFVDGRATDDHANGIRDAQRKIISRWMCSQLIIKMSLPCKALVNSPSNLSYTTLWIHRPASNRINKKNLLGFRWTECMRRAVISYSLSCSTSIEARKRNGVHTWRYLRQSFAVKNHLWSHIENT